jgi:hypothetical protein
VSALVALSPCAHPMLSCRLTEGRLNFPEPAKIRRCNNYGLMNKRTNWYGIRIFCDVAHKRDLPRGETCIAEDIRRSYQFYAKVEIARSSVPRGADRSLHRGVHV